MSQKNETTLLVLSLAVTLALVAAGLWYSKKFFAPTPSAQNPLVKVQISAGEKVLITSQATPEKQAAVQAIAAGNYSEAVSQLEKSLQTNHNDPEALAYLNNARIGNQKSYAIAASVFGVGLFCYWCGWGDSVFTIRRSQSSCSVGYYSAR